jgi:hypothetical protein
MLRSAPREVHANTQTVSLQQSPILLPPLCVCVCVCFFFFSWRGHRAEGVVASATKNKKGILDWFITLVAQQLAQLHRVCELHIIYNKMFGIECKRIIYRVHRLQLIATTSKQTQSLSVHPEVKSGKQIMCVCTGCVSYTLYTTKMFGIVCKTV